MARIASDDFDGPCWKGDYRLTVLSLRVAHLESFYGDQRMHNVVRCTACSVVSAQPFVHRPSTATYMGT